MQTKKEISCSEKVPKQDEIVYLGDKISHTLAFLTVRKKNGRFFIV